MAIIYWCLKRITGERNCSRFDFSRDESDLSHLKVSGLMTTLDKNVFTIESANLTLPLVRAIVRDLVELSNDIADTRERLDYLTFDRDREKAQDDYSKELSSIEKLTNLKSERVEQFYEELDELQVSSASAPEGYVDFVAVRNDTCVCLCWRLGEPEVAHWHELGEPCASRRPVDLALIRQSGKRRHSEMV